MVTRVEITDDELVKFVSALEVVQTTLADMVEAGFDTESLPGFICDAKTLTALLYWRQGKISGQLNLLLDNLKEKK